VSDRFEQACIISGIGQSDVGRRLTRSIMALTLDAALEAIADAGLRPADVDGVVSWPGEISRAEGLAPPGPGSSGPGVHRVIDALRLRTNWHYAGPETPGMLASVIHACMAVASGMCRHVLVYRALNEATAWRRATERIAADAEGVTGMMQWMLPFGAFSGPTWMALNARRHMHEYGTTREQIAQISLNARRNAALNPKAVLRDELTLDAYLSAPMISDPLCLYDCDIAVDGATAVVV
jgi:acetyl-CoA acetyltransferase